MKIDYKDKYIKLLKSINIDADILFDSNMVQMIQYSISAINPKVIDEEIKKQIDLPKNDLRDHLMGNYKIVDLKILKLDDFQNDIEFQKDFSLKSTQSENYVSKQIYEEIFDKSDLKFEIADMTNYYFYKLYATIIQETVEINMNQFKNIFIKLSKFGDDSGLKYLNIYYLTISDIFNPNDSFETNYNKLLLLTTGKFKHTNQLPLNILFRFGLFNENTLLWDTKILTKKTKTNIGQFSINQNGLLCNIFIDRQYRGMTFNDKKLIDCIIEKGLEITKEKGHKYSITTTKNIKVKKYLNKHGYQYIGETYPPMNLPGYTLINESVYIKPVIPTEDIDLTLIYTGVTNQPLVLQNWPKEEAKEKIIKLIESNYENVNIIGWTKDFLSRKLFDLHTLCEVVQETLIFRVADKVYSVPLLSSKDEITNVESYCLYEDFNKLSEYLYELDFKIIKSDCEKYVKYSSPNNIDIVNESILEQHQRKPYPVKINNIQYITKEDISTHFLIECGIIYGIDLFLDQLIVKDSNGYKYDKDQHFDLIKVSFRLKNNLEITKTLKELLYEAENRFINNKDWKIV